MREESEITMAQRVESYAPAAKWLHWIIALCVLMLVPAGIVMASIGPGPLQNQLYELHRSLGVLVLLLMIIRVFVRVSHGAPPPYAGLTTFERIASTSVHHLLYILLFIAPIIGWVMTSAYGAQIRFFGLFTVPAIVDKNEALFKTLLPFHRGAGIAIAILVGLHIAGALMHTFVKKDVVLWRMLPRRWS
jgi:cytochrome b561